MPPAARTAAVLTGLVLAAAGLLALAPACSGQGHVHGEHGPAAAVPEVDGPLGRLDFRTSGGEAAQAHFLRGVLWLHSFEYSDAREEFRRAWEAEPGFAMAAWGEAMTWNHPIWVRVDLEAGRAALERLGATREERLAAAPTERERAFVAAVEELFFGEGDKPERDRAYAEAMARLHRQSPEDPEAAAFYALALLGSGQGERDFATYMAAAAVVEEVYAANPDHPGALHYLIHAYDEAVHAPLGLRAARRYAEVASAAPHALHMPSHIFLALGLWDAVEASNRDAVEAAEERGGPNYHSLFWLQYALLQQGRAAEAAELLEEVKAAAAGGAGPARTHLAFMSAAQTVETAGRFAPPEVDTAGLEAGPVVIAAYARGYHAALAGDAAGARTAAAAIREAAAEEEGRDAGAAAICADQLEALALLASGAPGEGAAGGDAGDGATAAGGADEALDRLRAAAAAEDSLSLDIGPPYPPKPTWELLGETLLRLGRPAEARAAFDHALALAPGRTLALTGLAAAAAGEGDEEAAEEARGRVAGNLRKMDGAAADNQSALVP